MALLARRVASPTSGAFSPIIPLPRRWARAKTWATRARAGLIDGETLLFMRRMERANRG